MIIFWDVLSASGAAFDYPDAADVKIGVVYAHGARVGTYTGADRWSDPGVQNVRQGVTYLADAVTKRGQLVATNCDEVMGLVVEDSVVVGIVVDETVIGIVSC